MKLEENVRLSKLYDAYGPLLSDAQKEVVEAVLFDGLTGSEVAENKGVSRQAIKDALTKATKNLEEYDSKLHFIEKYEALKPKRRGGKK